MDRICNCPKIVTTNLKKYGIISEIQFGGVIMESGKNNRNEEMLDDYIGYRLATENSSQHSSFNLKGIVVAVLIIIGIAMIYDLLRRSELPGRLLRQLYDLLSPAAQQHPGLRQNDVVLAAAEQLDSQLLLQLHQLPG